MGQIVKRATRRTAGGIRIEAAQQAGSLWYWAVLIALDCQFKTKHGMLKTLAS